MTNKFISIVLSLVLIIGLFPVMSVSAADDVINIFEENFEDWTVGTKYYEGFQGYSSTLNPISLNGATKFSLGNLMAAEIVSMDGYDGNSTKAIKVISSSSTSGVKLNAGGGRLNFAGNGVTYTENSYTPSKSYVTEFKMYIPESINSGGETISQSIGSLNFGPFGKSGSDLVLRYTNSSGTAKTKTYTGVLTSGWHKFTIVQLFGSDGGKIIYYHNDNLLSYKEYAQNNASNRIQFTSTVTIPGQHLIFDDFKVYEGVITTTASSEFSGASDTSIRVNPTVTFSNSILNNIDGNPTFSPSNAIVTKAATSDAVAVNELSLSSDGKTLTVDIGEVLDYSTTYNVKLTGLKDVYDVIVPDYTFSFTTVEEPPFAFSAPVFKNEEFEEIGVSGTEITSLVDGDISASYTITNNDDSDTKDVFMFAVLRDDGALKAIEFKQGTVAPRSSLTLNAGFAIDDSENQSIEVYVWDNLIDRNALIPSYVISKDGITSTAE